MKILNRAVIYLLVVLCLSLYASTGIAKSKKDKKAPKTPGDVIFDTTANPGDGAIDVNLNFIAGGGKSDTAIDDGVGGNVINITDFQVLSRNIAQDPNQLKLFVGASQNTIADDRFGTDDQNTQFADGGHLFDLDRLRSIADWMSSGALAGKTILSNGTYGTISYLQFLKNIRDGITMYGLVRVQIPLELGASDCDSNKSDCTMNALGASGNSDLYGLCQSTAGLCSCAATTDADIKVGDTICGITMSATSRIKVRGSLFWDFVASQDSADTGLNQGDPIPLANLPFVPRELYFKVIIPIQVNWEHDLDDDGAMDNMDYIKQISDAGTDGATLTNKLDYLRVPASSKADYEYYTGVVLTKGVFDALDIPSQYHLMMATGYTTSWVEAFQKLGINGSDWTSIPGINPPLSLPNGVTGAITLNDVRSDSFEDIPAYLYSGGLIDMHDHVSISGMLYVPQGMELEAKKDYVRQYVIGAVVVRDTFFIEAKTGTVTVFSSDPSSYSTALLSASAAAAVTPGTFVPSIPVFEGSGGGSSPDPDVDDGGAPGSCYTGCAEGSGSGPGSAAAPPGPAGARRWIEVRPNGG